MDLRAPTIGSLIVLHSGTWYLFVIAAGDVWRDSCWYTICNILPEQIKAKVRFQMAFGVNVQYGTCTSHMSAAPHPWGYLVLSIVLVYPNLFSFFLPHFDFVQAQLFEWLTFLGSRVISPPYFLKGDISPSPLLLCAIAHSETLSLWLIQEVDWMKQLCELTSVPIGSYENKWNCI